MDWVTIFGLFRQGACLTPEDAPADPGQEPGAGDHLALALAAVAVAGVAGCEMQLIAVGNPADFARIFRRIHVPLMVLLGALVSFPSVAPVTASLACAFLIIRVL